MLLWKQRRGHLEILDERLVPPAAGTRPGFDIDPYHHLLEGVARVAPVSYMGGALGVTSDADDDVPGLQKAAVDTSISQRWVTSGIHEPLTTVRRRASLRQRTAPLSRKLYADCC